MARQQPIGLEHRKFIRLESVFPVLFKIILPEGTDSRFQWFQGFTSNVSEGGICLEVNDIRPEVLELLKTRTANLSLVIEIPVGGKPVHAQAKPAWFSEIKGKPSKVIIGLRYEAILPSHRDRILRVARMKAYFTPVSIVVMCSLGLLIVAHSVFNMKHTADNRRLVRSDVVQLQLSVVQEKLADAEKEKTALTAQDAAEPAGARLEEVTALINRLAAERDALQRTLDEPMRGR